MRTVESLPARPWIRGRAVACVRARAVVVPEDDIQSDPEPPPGARAGGGGGEKKKREIYPTSYADNPSFVITY